MGAKGNNNMAAMQGKPWPREVETRDYLEEHRILELFDNLTAALIYSQPSNPKEFLIEQIEKLQKSQKTKLDYPCLFDETNIQSIFGMLDPTSQGYITLQQYREALTTLGITDYSQNPVGGEVNKISLDTFGREAKAGLVRASATHKDSVKK